MDTNKQWEGLFNAIREKDWPGAVKIIDGIITSDSENPNLYLKRGDICLKAGDKAESVNSYLSAAWFLKKEGFLKKALAAYKLVLRYDADNDEALHESNRIMMELESISESPKKAEWMIFAPDEIPPVAARKKEDTSKQSSGLGQAGAALKGSEAVVPLGLLPYFTAEEIEKILGRATIKKFSEGKLVVREGDSGDSVYIIKSGFAYVVGHFFGKVLLLDTLSAGDLFGEMAFLTGRTRTASVIAKGDLAVYEIERPLLEELVEQRPEILSQLSSLYVKRVKQSLDKLKSKK